MIGKILYEIELICAIYKRMSIVNKIINLILLPFMFCRFAWMIIRGPKMRLSDEAMREVRDIKEDIIKEDMMKRRNMAQDDVEKMLFDAKIHSFQMTNREMQHILAARFNIDPAEIEFEKIAPRLNEELNFMISRGRCGKDQWNNFIDRVASTYQSREKLLREKGNRNAFH